MLTHLDLCSGIGGFSIAAAWAGFVTVGFAEVEPYCCALLKEKWPLVPNYGDLRRADFSRLRGRVDVLSAGVPCQPSSCAGKRRGAGDDRWLWDSVLDVVGVVEPAWVIFENPAGILSLGEFEGILLRLGEIGYAVRLFSVPANAVGAKHRRQRVFVVANAESQRRTGLSIGTEAPYALFGSNRETLADAEARGIRCGLPQWETGQSAQCSQALADTDSAQRRRAQSAGNEHNGEETGRGESPNRSEGVCDPPGSSAEFRLTEPPLCRRTDGIRGRSYRLKALGNAVVPQVAYPFFEAIRQTVLTYGCSPRNF